MKRLALTLGVLIVMHGAHDVEQTYFCSSCTRWMATDGLVCAGPRDSLTICVPVAKLDVVCFAKSIDDIPSGDR